jgi:putative restriction endonuclease
MLGHVPSPESTHFLSWRAAHIKPYATGGEHVVANGIVLRSDLHRLFDHGYITVDADYRLVVGRRLKAHYQNGRSYYNLHGQALTLPGNSAMHPSTSALEWHRRERFLG